MITRRRTSLFLICLLSLFFSGCAVKPATSFHTLKDDKAQIITTDSSARVIFLLKKADGSLGVCAEPSPDSAMTTITKLLGELSLQRPQITAKGQKELETSVVDLTKRSQTISLLRESLYRICEAGMNHNLTGAEVLAQQELALRSALKLAEAELARNRADLLKTLQDEPLPRDGEASADE